MQQKMWGHLVVHRNNKVTFSLSRELVPPRINYSYTKEAHIYYERLSIKCKTKIELYHLWHVGTSLDLLKQFWTQFHASAPEQTLFLRYHASYYRYLKRNYQWWNYGLLWHVSWSYSISIHFQSTTQSDFTVCFWIPFFGILIFVATDAFKSLFSKRAPTTSRPLAGIMRSFVNSTIMFLLGFSVIR